MNLSNQLAQENRSRIVRKKNQENRVEFLEAYCERPEKKYLNEEKGVFVKAGEEGLNKMTSIFDRTAVFHVDNRI